MKEHFPAIDSPQDRRGMGIAAVVAAGILFTIVDALAKWLGQIYSPFEIVFFRYLFGLLPIALLLWRSGGIQILRTKRPWAHGLRALLLFVALVSFFGGLRALPLAEAIAIAFTSPLFVAGLAGPMLGETVGPRRWSAVVVGFIGAVVIIRPGTEAFEPAALLVILSAISFALAMLLTRRLTRTETSVALLTYSTIAAGIACLPFLALEWQSPDGDDLGLFLLLGVIGGFAAYLVIVGHGKAPAIVLAPFQYLGLIWGALVGWLVWREVPDAAVWFGAVIIALSSAYVTYREAVVSRGRR